MSFQDTRTPQYPEMQKTETLRLAKKSSAKTRRQQAKHRHNKKIRSDIHHSMGKSRRIRTGFPFGSTQFTTFQTVISVIFTGKLYHK